MTASFTKRATVDCSTKKKPDVASGIRGVPVTYLTGLKCTPLDPLDSSTARRLQLETPYHRLQTFISGDLDIVAGHILVVGAEEYPIAFVDQWTDFDGTPYRHLILEKPEV